MMPSKESLAKRRQFLSEQAARQRIELGQAFQDLGKPFQYTQKAVVGLQALRKNAWLVGLAPSAVSLLFSFFGWEKKGRPSLLGRLRRKPAKDLEKQEAEAAALKAKKPLQRWLGRGWALFQLYRRIRPYFP